MAELLQGHDSGKSSDKGGSASTGKENTTNRRPGGDSHDLSKTKELPSTATTTRGNDDTSGSSVQRIVLVGDRYPWSRSQWDECPEDIALTAQRLCCMWQALSQEPHTLSLSMGKVEQVSLRLVTAARKLETVTDTNHQQDSAILLMTSAAVMSCFGGLAHVVQSSLAHQAVYANYGGQSSLFTSNDKLQDYLKTILSATFSQGTNETSAATMQCLSALSDTFGDAIICPVLSKFCGFESYGLSKALVYDEPEDGDSGRSDVKFKRLLSLIKCVFLSQNKSPMSAVGDTRYIRVSRLLIDWIHSR